MITIQTNEGTYFLEAKDIISRKFQNVVFIEDNNKELEKEMKNQLLQFEKQRLNQILNQYGYNGLGDVLFYVSQNDSEAQALQNWYKAYDDAVWNFIENQIPTYTSLDQLLELNMKQVEQNIFNQSISTNPLP